MEHRLSHERRAGYKGTAARLLGRLGPPLNTPSARSPLATRIRACSPFPPRSAFETEWSAIWRRTTAMPDEIKARRVGGIHAVA